MTEKQQKFYIDAALKAYRADDRGAETFDEFRHRLVREALGQDKSFAKFTNPDLDRVLAHFKLYAHPDDFEAALAAVNAAQNGRRRRLLRVATNAIAELGAALEPDGGPHLQSARAKRYLWVVYEARTFGRKPHPDTGMPADFPQSLDDEQLTDLVKTATRARTARERKGELCTTR